MCMKPTCTRSTFLFWVRQMSNYSIRRHRAPPSKRSRQAKTLLDTWWSSRSSASLKYLNNTPSGIYDCQPGNFLIPWSTPTRTRMINWSCYVMHRRKTRHVMGDSYQGESKNLQWIYYISLSLKHCRTMRRSRRRHQEEKFSVPSSTLKICTKPFFLN